MIFSSNYIRGGEVMPKGKYIIHYKQKRAAHWAARFLRLWDFVTTISTARRNFSFLWLDWIELLDSMGAHGEARSGGSFVVSGMGHALRS